MTPDLLKQYLEAMRSQRTMHCAVTLPCGADMVTINATFAPDDQGPMPGEQPTPGGWKGPDRLDNAEQFSEIP